jgi:hypothetical protein
MHAQYERFVPPVTNDTERKVQDPPAYRVNDAGRRLLKDLERKYLWWGPVGGEPRSELRIVAQIMNFGTYDDIRRVEMVLGPHCLSNVMRRAEPGWFSDRSWEFWRGRLSRALEQAMPEEAPRRSFRAEVL